MKKLMLALFLLVGTLSFGQMQTQDAPDCQVGLDSDGTANLNSIDIDNRISVCTSWTLVYTSTGFSAVSIEFQSAPDSGGAPGAYVTWANVDSGSTLPLTSTAGGQVMGFRFQPHARIHINSATGTGRIIARLLGYKPFKGATDPTNGGTNVSVINSPSVQGFAVTGTAIASAGNPVPAGCDSSTTGAVTAGQLQVIRCSPSGTISTIIGATNNADGNNAANGGGLENANGSGLPLHVWPDLFNGTSYDRTRTSSLVTNPTAVTLTARNSIGAAITEKGSRWAVNSAPAAGSQATASIAAEAAVRHVLDTLCFSSGSAVAPVLTSLQVNVRDGATGAGTVLLTFELDIPATTGQDTPPMCINGLNLVGTTNTAMTVEWSASLANLKQTATAIGFNVN